MRLAQTVAAVALAPLAVYVLYRVAPMAWPVLSLAGFTIAAAWWSSRDRQRPR